MSILIKGLGGFGFKGKGIIPPLLKVPERKPDHILKGTSYPNQAWLYRLTGDINPLHVDPNISSIQNFDRPILHGIFIFNQRFGQLWNSSKSYCSIAFRKWSLTAKKLPSQICRACFPWLKFRNKCMERRKQINFWNNSSRKRYKMSCRIHRNKGKG